MSISYEWKGVQVLGSECAWSRVENFNFGDKLPCEPKVVAELEGASNFETCIHGNCKIKLTQYLYKCKIFRL